MNYEESIWLDRLKEEIRLALGEEQDKAKGVGVPETPVVKRPDPPVKKKNRVMPSNRPDDVSKKAWQLYYVRDWGYCAFHGGKVGLTAMQYARNHGIVFGLRQLALLAKGRNDETD